ncbi:MAG: MATE family efflux transporter [Lachnospiraceae bacterium]
MNMRVKKASALSTQEVDWKSFYHGVFLLVIPMAIQNLINVGVSAADVIMLGRVGEKVLSGASLAGQVQFVMTLIFYGITSGITVMTAQYWGKGDTRTIEKILGIGLVSGVFAGTIFTVAALVMPENLMRIFTTDSVVIAEGVKYLRIIACSYILMAITQVYLNVMRSIERVVVATVVYTSSLGVNVLINALLIFGLCGFPKMGIQGAAIGTLIARLVETLIVFFYALKMNRVVRIRWKDCIHFDKILLRDYMIYAMPVIINEMMWGLGFSTNSAIIGHLGSAAVAANAVAQVARQLSTVIVFGISNATAIYLGKTIGEKKYEHAKLYGAKFLKLSLITGLIAGVCILIAAPIANANLVLSVRAKEYLQFMFFVMSYFTVSQSINSTLIVGVFRSGGDIKFALVVDTVIMWCGSITIGAIAAFVFHCNVHIVYVILMSDEVLKLPITIKRFFSYKWLKNVTREIEYKE